MPLSEIIKVSITRESAGISRASFGIPMIVGENATFTERSKKYSSSDLSGLADDLTNGTADPEYKMAVAVCSANPKPEYFMVGKIESGDANLTETLNEIKNYDNSWYFVLLCSRVKADQQEVITWTESNNKIFIVATSESKIADIVENLDTDSLAKFSNAYDRSLVIYHTKAGDGLGIAAEEYPDGALVGKIAPLTIGSYTAMFKTLNGITNNVLTPNQTTNIIDKNANLYEEFAGKNIFREGKVGSGELIETIIFIDWLTARIQESVFSLLSKSLKIPYTDEGISQIANALEQPLKVGQDNGGISFYAVNDDDEQIGGYIINAIKLKDVDPIDKANNILRKINFKAWLSGSIHYVVIDGVVIV